MKTIKQATDEIMALKTLAIGSIEPSVNETIRDVALEHYRAGMEAASRMCSALGDREKTHYSYLYNAAHSISDAAKTAQLP